LGADAVAYLVDLGLSRNEAQAYVTLLEHPDAEGATGYEVAARSGVPRSAIYTVLGKLEQSGAVFCVGERPGRYVPTDPTRFVEHLRQVSEGRLARAADALQDVPKRRRPEPIWTVSRYEDVLRRIDEMIRAATTSVYLSVWAREMDQLREAADAVAAGKMHRVLYSPEPFEAPPGFSCWFDETADEQKARWSHKALVVVDRREALIGGTEPDVDNHGVWTSNPSLIDVATNHIILDITRLSRETGRDCTGDVAPMMRPHLDGV